MASPTQEASKHRQVGQEKIDADSGGTCAQRSSTQISLRDGETGAVLDATHRNLKARHIQLIGIGGTIGTALYVQIGQGLLSGGPASLLLAFSIWCSFILAVTVSIAEMVTYLPISSPAIRFSARFVDEAFGFAAGWNFFIYEAFLVAYEITACVLIIRFWTDAIPAAAIIGTVLVFYSLINCATVKWFGEIEFWAALTKLILIIGLITFTFIVMVGGNPHHDRFGFRYWNNPGAFAELYYDGDLGRLLGFLQCLIQAAFTIAGPDYVSITAGEAENPRKVMPRAFNTVFYRLTTFFILGALCVGILVPHNDPEMSGAFTSGQPGAAASPYVVAMNRLDISVLPHIVNGVILLSAFSAGNSFVYCASRSLYGLALEGMAPKLFTSCTRRGVPIYCVTAVLSIGLISFLQVSSGTAVVLGWLVSLVTASQLINYCTMCTTYLRFYKALEAQHVDRNLFQYRAWFMPYTAWYGLVGTFVMTFIGGYAVFLPIDGQWSIATFLFSYAMVGVFIILYVGWKIINKTHIQKSTEVDLYKGLDSIESYERSFVPESAKPYFS
ncbi:unnamed protein product [Clonostachys rosea]|uniref:Amino acid permease/ SLC12A domain-containing protein n=1 Tax=Bionectria ochroleuca TaxID=29856 RepID=A0ABY6U786_BIOOC|nr:unnamed protein product [Clonostachys rosea]